MKTSIVRCDDCGRSTKMDVHTRKFAMDREEVYFDCKHCEEHYTCYVTDTIVRKWQGEILKTRDHIERLGLKMRVKERMDKLKAELNMG